MAKPAPVVGVGLPQGQGTVGVTVHAPLGGINAISAAGAMPDGDCLALKNMIPFQYGLRVRSGYVTHVEGIAEPVRSIQAFTGSAEDGSRDRLFACTQIGIYDVTTAGAKPLVYTFPSQTIRSGTGNSTSFVNLNGIHYLAYCDGSNGYLLYTEKTDTWTKVLEGTADGEISGVNPGTFRFVMQWKNRLWFIVGNSTKSYYLDVRAFAGEAHQLNFAPRMRYGGNLVGLYSWTRDGGNGVDDYLVGIGRGGDVVVYAGSDPAFADTFEMKGVYWVGPVPPGRNIATDFGGDLFVLSQQGCMPLSRLTAGAVTEDNGIYASAKITNLFTRLMAERGGADGWAITRHPSDNLLVINVPAAPGGTPEQLVMSLATKGWAQHSGLPMKCLATWRGKLYFGTDDGRVCANEGYTDDDGHINFALMTAYQDLGTPKQKRIHMARPYFITDGTGPGYSVQARFNYDLSDVALAYVTPTATGASWDSGVWDTAEWGSGGGTAGRQRGTTGLGAVVALVLRGTSKASTTLASIDVFMDVGGML
jgi:hypothetical protein